MRYVTVLNQKTVRSVKSKYKKYDNGGKPKKKKRSKKTEFARQMEELALAAKIMMLEGIMDPEDMPAEITSYIDRGMMGGAIDQEDSDPMYTMRPYIMDPENLVMARNSRPGKEEYSKRIPMQEVRDARFPELMLPKKKISLF